MNDSELMFELKSGGCAAFGDQDEIERFFWKKGFISNGLHGESWRND